MLTIHRLRSWTVLLLKYSPLKLGISLLVLMLLLFWLDGVNRKYVPSDFSYSATVIATDNSYDYANNRFAGERYSRGNFFLQPTAVQGKTAKVQGMLAVTSIDGEHIATINRQYTMYTATGQHIALHDQLVSYLFAPRNLHKGQPFNYQHITYNDVASMRYVGQESLLGLKVYRYHATYPHGGHVQQDTTISSLNIPKDQSVVYEPGLDIWVEPVTGWLIKFREDSNVYAYDKASRKSLTLISHFSNAYTDESVSQHVKYATDLKHQAILRMQVVPTMLLLMAFAGSMELLVRRWRIVSLPVQLAMATALALSLSGIAGWLLHIPPLYRLFSGNIPVSPVTMFCFVLLSAATLLLYRKVLRHVVRGLAATVAVVATLELAVWSGYLPWHIDTWFIARLPHAESLPMVQMTIVSACMFLALSLGILYGVTARKAQVARLAYLAVGLATALAGFILLCKILLLDQLFDVTFLGAQPMLLPLLFTCIGVIALKSLQLRATKPAQGRTIVHDLVWSGLVIVPVIVIGGLAQLQYNAGQRQLQASFSARTQSIQKDVAHGMASYTHMLQGAAALFAASNAVEPDEWHSYISALDVTRQYPGALTTGFLRQVDASQAAAFGSPIFPAGSRAQYVPVQYVEPQSPEKRRILGYDMLTDPVRRLAMLRARDTGRPTLSGQVNLLQDTGVSLRHGFVVFVPVYQAGVPATTIAQRRQAIEGYVYGVVSSDQFLDAILPAADKTLSVVAYDGIQPSQAAFMHRNSGSPRSGELPATTLNRNLTVYMAEHPWTIRYTALPGFRLSSAQEHAPSLIMIVGNALYFMAILLFYSLHTVRHRVATMIEHTGKKR